MTGYLCDPETGDPYTAETFDLDSYLGQFDPDWFESSAGRIELTRDDILLFGIVFLPHVLKNAEGEITFSDVHLGLYRDAMLLRHPAEIGGDRRAYIAPRGSGKSSTTFLLTNLWIACHHSTFVAAFSSSAQQSIDHLKALRRELDRNKLLRSDFPDACTPQLKPSGQPVAAGEDMLLTRNGFCFTARGIDTEVLGLVDPLNRRPEIILLDDCEKAEGSTGYSIYQAGQRLKTITDGILPMNDRAHVRLVGTVTIVGGILHDLVSTVVTKDPPAEWIVADRWQVIYFPAIIEREDGTPRSVWPGKWPIDYLLSIATVNGRPSRSFAKNFNNIPLGADGDYWTEADITYGTCSTLTRRILRIDPATTTKRSSDRTGVAIVAYSPTERLCVVEHAEGVRLTGKRLGVYLTRLVAGWPHRVHIAIVESNQGGDLWPDVLDQLPIPVRTIASTVSKEERFAAVLDFYQARPAPRVVHAEVFPLLEQELTGFPKAANDDVADAVCAGVLDFLKPPRRQQVGVRHTAYA